MEGFPGVLGRIMMETAIDLTPLLTPDVGISGTRTGASLPRLSRETTKYRDTRVRKRLDAG